ncbi:MAG: hypothetical protein L7W43_04000, partial [Rubripirellula sp.]|nr:hypothetical protein [Rubripirellula sp.]
NQHNGEVLFALRALPACRRPVWVWFLLYGFGKSRPGFGPAHVGCAGKKRVGDETDLLGWLSNSNRGCLRSVVRELVNGRRF